MKAGILTFHLADNYGAVLQAYALRQVLLKFGVASEILTTDFSNGSYEERNCFSGAAAVLKKRILSENEKRHRLFEEFREGYLRCSPKYEDRELEKANPLYDFFIAGSDQVWNLRIPG
ncbi:MAG: polysaccharide pyruvyl transferase family protein, partial [bacterium]